MGSDTPSRCSPQRPRLCSTTSRSCSRSDQPAAGRHPPRSCHSLMHHDRPRGSTVWPPPGPMPADRAAVPVNRPTTAAGSYITADGDLPGLKAITVSGPLQGGRRAGAALRDGWPRSARGRRGDRGRASIVVLSDRHSDAEHARPLLPHLGVHTLIREKTRTAPRPPRVVEAATCARCTRRLLDRLQAPPRSSTRTWRWRLVEDGQTGRLSETCQREAIRNLNRRLGKACAR